MSTPMATAHRVRLSLAATASTACVGLIVRLALRVARFNQVMAAVRWLAGTTRHDATRDEVMHALHAVDAAAAWVPFRIACMERSLTAVVLLAARRRGVTWQMGVRTPRWPRTLGLPMPPVSRSANRRRQRPTGR